MKKLLLLFTSLAVLTACSSNENGDDPSGDSFNRTALLTHWADNIIIPAYQNYGQKVYAFTVDTEAFRAEPNQQNLNAMRNSWLAAYEAYQKVMLFTIGKAADINFKERTNTYPTDIVGIQQNISTGNYNFELLSQYSKQGFPAFDYMINGVANSDTEILAYYTTDANAVASKQYLSNLVTVLYSNSNAILMDWNGSFRNSFISNNGTAVSSSTNKMTNLFVKNFEKDIRSGKVGIPAGIFSNGTVFPEKVEAYYKGDISKMLLITAIKSQQDFFNGKYFASAQVGPSLKSYLDEVNAVRGGMNLSTIINNQFETIYSATALLNSNLSEQVANDNAKMIQDYDAMQQNVVYFKLDMMQALNITVDYVDGDGD